MTDGEVETPVGLGLHLRAIEHQQVLECKRLERLRWRRLGRAGRAAMPEEVPWVDSVPSIVIDLESFVGARARLAPPIQMGMCVAAAWLCWPSAWEMIFRCSTPPVYWRLSRLAGWFG